MLKTFRMGGVHPPENKVSAKANLVQVLPEGVAVIPIAQHIGAPASPLVAKGDKVKVGQLIARAAGFVSANVHSGVSGTVIAVDARPCDASGVKKTCISIQIEGDEWEPGIDRSKDVRYDISLSAAEILHRIQESGIVGLGGATFPSHVKLTVPQGRKAEVLIINAVECEPYLTADHRLMLEHGEEVLIGAQILMQTLGIEHAYIGIENNKPDAIAHLKQLAGKFEGIAIVPLQVKYPQGGEKQLIQAIIGKEVPSMGLPIETGAVVHNVATAYAVYEAVQKNKPLIERIVTVTGKQVAKPSNFVARVGTPISQLVALAGGVPNNTGKIVLGGPMMGRATASIADLPVSKGTSGVLFFDNSEAHRAPKSNCIRCAKCVQVCPMGLEPYLISKQSKLGMWEQAEAGRVFDCIECGCCSFTCPANIPLLDFIRLGKGEALKRMRARAVK